MKKIQKYNGVVVPMVTPFTQAGELDESAVFRIVDHLLMANVYPFVLGTTGEAASIPGTMRLRLVELVTQRVAGRTKTFAGIANNSFRVSVDDAKRYFDLGIDVFVAHLPSYYLLTPAEMLHYFETLASSIPGPLMIYNIPQTTHMSIPLEVIEALTQHPNIVGMKDSERDPERLKKAIMLCSNRPNFSHLTGWGAKMMEALVMGSDGMVPSTGNIVPHYYAALYNAVLQDEQATAQKLQEETDAISALYQKDRTQGQSLAALKVILSLFGLCEPDVLLPIHRSGTEAEAEIQRQTIEMKIRTQTA